jgi:hypothetical protein
MAIDSGAIAGEAVASGEAAASEAIAAASEEAVVAAAAAFQAIEMDIDSEAIAAAFAEEEAVAAVAAAFDCYNLPGAGEAASVVPLEAVLAVPWAAHQTALRKDLPWKVPPTRPGDLCIWAARPLHQNRKIPVLLRRVHRPETSLPHLHLRKSHRSR